jgi:hypothetical protein
MYIYSGHRAGGHRQIIEVVRHRWGSSPIQIQDEGRYHVPPTILRLARQQPTRIRSAIRSAIRIDKDR